MSLQAYCRKPVVRISPETNITEACQLLEQNNIGCLIAEREGKPCGIVTDRDIALRVTAPSAIPTKPRSKRS
jgi:CBS domain-containing protein